MGLSPEGRMNPGRDHEAEKSEVFGIKAVLVAYVTTGQIPEHRERRKATMTRWIWDVLAELDMEDWAGNFLCTSIVLDEVYEQALFENAVWSKPKPDVSQPVPLFAPKHNQQRKR